MISIDSPISFSVYNNQLRNEETLNELALLKREYWSEINYPHDTYPVDHYKILIKNRKNSQMKFIHILMKDKENNPIGFASLDINIGTENRSLCSTDYYIKPQFRMQGLFRKLFLESVKIMPEEVKVVQFFFRVDNNQQNAEQKINLNSKLMELSNVLEAKLSSIGRRSISDVTKIDLKILSKKARELELKAQENDLSIYFVQGIEFENLPFTRSQYIKFLVEIDNDMPRDDSSMDDHSFTEEDYINSFVEINNPGFKHWIFIAIDKNTKLPIAMTETFLHSSNPDLARVGDTGVKREYRGKKLGLTLKTLMLERLLTDPLTKDKIKYWVTFNVVSNKYMITVNDQLGYVQSSIEHQWEVSVEKLKNYFGSH